MQQVWFITGSSRGLGRALAGAALDAGDSVVATARQPGQLAEFADRYGDRVLPLALDVTDAGAVRDAVAAGTGRFGRLDVVVNNAGYANVAPVETGDETDFRTQFETNFWGVYKRVQGGDPPAAGARRRDHRAVLLGWRACGRLAGHRQLPGCQVRGRRV
ncbi:MAG: SDR family NAD(P)-dependent oxidoreductase [Streptosporangiaceae bacterium]